MAGMDPKTQWVERIFDTSEPYLYIIVLPALVLFALGFRSQAVIFAIGAAAFLTVIGLS